jgi:hypothetical protein
MKAARERLVLDHRNVVGLGDFADLERDVVEPFGDDDRRCLIAADVAQCHGIVRRIGDHDSRARHGRQHPAA